MRPADTHAGQNPVVVAVDQQIAAKRAELNKLEAIRNLAVAGEPVASITSKRGSTKRKRRFRASEGDTTTGKRKRGRPKGSKNKPKDAPQASNTGTKEAPTATKDLVEVTA